MVIIKKYNKQLKKKKLLTGIITLIIIIAINVILFYQDDIEIKFNDEYSVSTYNLQNIPEYKGESYVTINNNQPDFTEEDISVAYKEKYSDLDYLGRCGVAIAKVGIDTMPTEKRGSIGTIKPTGWHTIKYDNIDGKYLYNRCHLIGYQLTGENANPKNLITCTRNMNTVGMLEFENKVAKYVNKTNNHVLYRVTPIFKDNNLLASGVQMEAKSIEDNGSGISFNVYVYNVQEDIVIDYLTGKSSLSEKDISN